MLLDDDALFELLLEDLDDLGLDMVLFWLVVLVTIAL
jgi:hypothetical protein